MTALILLYENVHAYEALGALAALRAADAPAELVARDALVQTREGARVVPHRLGHDAIPDADCLILPGGEPDAALRDADLVRALRARRGRWTLASGDAQRIAHAAGLADGRRIARAEPLPGTDARPARLVEDGRLLTCTGGDALLDLALHYAARAFGHHAARRAADALGREHRPFVLGAAGDGDDGA